MESLAIAIATLTRERLRAEYRQEFLFFGPYISFPASTTDYPIIGFNLNITFYHIDTLRDFMAMVEVTYEEVRAYIMKSY